MLNRVRRGHVLLMIVVVLMASCLLAAAKLRATPKYDRIQVGMTFEQVNEIMGGQPTVDIFDWDGEGKPVQGCAWHIDEGKVEVRFQRNWRGVKAKTITGRGPLERLAWLVGWR